MRGIPRQAVHANTKILGTNIRAIDIAHTNSICPVRDLWNREEKDTIDDVVEKTLPAHGSMLLKLY